MCVNSDYGGNSDFFFLILLKIEQMLIYLQMRLLHAWACLVYIRLCGCHI